MLSAKSSRDEDNARIVVGLATYGNGVDHLRCLEGIGRLLQDVVTDG